MSHQDTMLLFQLCFSTIIVILCSYIAYLFGKQKEKEKHIEQLEEITFKINSAITGNYVNPEKELTLRKRQKFLLTNIDHLTNQIMSTRQEIEKQNKNIETYQKRLELEKTKLILTNTDLQELVNKKSK